MSTDPHEIISTFPHDLEIVKELVYDKCGFDLINLQLNKEGKEYGATSYNLNGKIIQHRVSKITPAKTGQFVTIWKRNRNGITEPYHISDKLDFIIISVKNGDKLGIFIFPTLILADKGIIAQNDKGGKRGIRIYPPRDMVSSKQAKETQSWQTRYFMMIYPENSTDLNLARKLLA